MIYSLTSDLLTFKTLTFKKGLNILLADKNENATNQQTRNGAGKTSFVELVNFLLGANIEKKGLLTSQTLENTCFSLKLDIENYSCEISRSPMKRSNIYIDGNLSELPFKSKFDGKIGRQVISVSQLKQILGKKWFGLEEADEDQSFKPTYRSLVSYYMRRQSAGGFFTPTKYSNIQPLWNEQISICYFLGVDWTIARDFELLREDNKIPKQLKSALKEGKLGISLEKTADLRTKIAVSEAKLKRLKEQLSSFKVVPEYEKLEKEASALTKQISEINNSNTIDHEMLLNLTSALESEPLPAKESLKEMYREAGIILPQLINKRFEEVEKFHVAIVENRRFHLTSEINTIKKRIADRDVQRKNLDIRRSEVMSILSSGGALESYTLLREELGRLQADTQLIREHLQIAERIENNKAELDIKRANLNMKLQSDIRERQDIINEAILIFEDFSEKLYDKEKGSLIVSATNNGPTLEVKIDSKRSTGINNMQIFCFDLMLMELSSRRGFGPGFLIHDSHLFDGVDERQVAKALQLGAESAEKNGFQYIVTLNSDTIPAEGFVDEFDFNKYVIPTRLIDTEEGGLFGCRFN